MVQYDSDDVQIIASAERGDRLKHVVNKEIWSLYDLEHASSEHLSGEIINEEKFRSKRY